MSETDVAAQAAAILADEASDDATTFLTDAELDGLPQDTIEGLVRLSLPEDEIGPYYLRVIGLVSAELQKEMSDDIGEHTDPIEVVRIMQDERSGAHRDAIMSAYVLSGDGESMSQVFSPTIGLVSAEVQEKMVTQLGESGTDADDLIGILTDEASVSHRKAIAQAIADDNEWDNDEITKLIAGAGHCLDDATIVILARAMQDEKPEKAVTSPEA